MKDSYFFDKKDHQLLALINKTIEAAHSNTIEKHTLITTLHPEGIQNLTTSHVARMAYAVANLLGSLDASSSSSERLSALRILHEEVIHSAQTTFRFNTARVLIQIMKEIVRARGDEETQLKLIHDFRNVAAGNPRVVRKFLTKQFLLEMPEEWNQKTLDDHVHDSSTLGRKNATYLIMDAWVKGIRRLMVAYHHYVEPEVARELLEAAEIMGINVRIGLKFKTIFRGRYVEFLWTPRGFLDTDDFIGFLTSPEIQTFMNKGRAGEEWTQKLVYKYLDHYNDVHAPRIAKDYGIEKVLLDKVGFADFLGRGQGSLLRLAEFAHKCTLPLLKEQVKVLTKRLENADIEEAGYLRREIKQLDELTPAAFYEKWIRCDQNPDLPSLDEPQDDDRPEILKTSLQDFVKHIGSLRVGCRLTLLLKDLDEADFLEILWECQGTITDIEIFNMKDWLRGRLSRIKEINEVQTAVNNNNIIILKHILHRILKEEKIIKEPERAEKFTRILENIPSLINCYRRTGINSRIGTDSTGHLGLRYGMGLVVPETLPRSARSIIENKDNGFEPFVLPLSVSLSFVDKYKNKTNSPFANFVRQKLGFQKFGTCHTREWKGGYNNLAYTEKGNIVTLGGTVETPKNGFQPKEKNPEEKKFTNPARYLNTTYSNILKVCIGFFPAFLTFMITQDWWFLAWFGALIWFSITGIRNIIQAIIAGSGMTKSMLLSWKELINWTRVSESLMYTGMSVVLLEGLTRNGLLGHVLGITVETMPLVVFTIIALANGLYISSHNIFRGFPKTAIVGNFFRSILAIPVAMVYNSALAVILPVITGLPAEMMLVPGAAIVSKLASDTVAGVIEATADRKNNYRLRGTDYSERIRQLFNCFTKLELNFPDKDVLKLMEKPQEFIKEASEVNKPLETEAIAISLDLMYFWYYKPCAQQTLLAKMKSMTMEEREVFVRFQSVLEDHREVAKLFLDGLLGYNFSKALAFYLDNYSNYLEALQEICAQLDHPVEAKQGASEALPNLKGLPEKAAS